MKKCWCGNTHLKDYSNEYYQCDKCKTLITKTDLDVNVYDVQDEENDLYGENYWQEQMLRLSGQKSMDDIIDFYLQERCVYWLKYVLKYIPVGSKIAEVGCGLGQFAYMCKMVGYEQTAFELSPEICAFIKKKLDVNIICGELSTTTEHYEAVMGFDLFEHIIENDAFLDTIENILSEDGIICFQTPCYNPKLSFGEMKEKTPRFEEQLKAREHVFLYSKESITAILNNHGFKYINFEPAFFGDEYDMFLFASRKPFDKIDENVVNEALNQKANGRLIKALITLFDKEGMYQEKLLEREKDADGRLEQVETLTGWLKDKEKEAVLLQKNNKDLDNFIEKQKDDIQKQEEDIGKQKEIIENQEEIIEKQKEIIEKQKETIEKQKEDIESLEEHKQKIHNLEKENHMLHHNQNSIKWTVKNIPRIIYNRFNRDTVRTVKKNTLKTVENGVEIKTVAMDLTSIRPDGSSGGANGFAIELTKGLVESGLKVVVLSANWNTKYLKELFGDRVAVVEMIGKEKSKLYNRIFNKLRRMGLLRISKQHVLKDLNVDVLCCPFSAATFAEEGIPVVSTILDIQHEFYPTFFDPKELQGRRNFYKELIQKVNTITCISDYTKETFCEKYDFPRENAYTIYIAIQDRFNKFDDSVLERFDIKDNEYIVYPANFWEHKNHKMLLTSFGMYKKNHPDAKLVLTGNPLEKEEYYNQLLKALEIDGNVVITKYLKEEELFSILKHARGLIFPSLFEGFGIPLVEAMHLGKLIASSNKTSLPEVGCDAIYYFDPRKADEIYAGIEYLYNNEMTDDILAEYQEKLKEYQTDVMVDKYLEVFETALKADKKTLSKDACYDIYPDMWLGETFRIDLAEHKGQKVKVIFNLPDYVGKKVRIRVEKENETKMYKFKTGRMVFVEELINSDSESISFHFLDIWTPAMQGMGDDQRKLSVLLSDVEIVDEEKSYSILPKEEE